MIKSEQFGSADQLQRAAASTPTVCIPSQPYMRQNTTKPTAQRSIDPHAIDISSTKGRFAWETIPFGDTYMPVIFRGTTKYFCVKMLHKLLPEYPEDVVRRSAHYQYRKPISLYIPTADETKLLNMINAHHSHWVYSRQPFTPSDELVRVSDFLPFYEHLRLAEKPTHAPRTSSTGSARRVAPQAQQSTEYSLDFVEHASNGVRRASSVSHTGITARKSPPSASDLSRQRAWSLTRPVPLTPTALRPSRPSRPDPSSSQSSQYPSTFPQQSPVPPSLQVAAVVAIKPNSAMNSKSSASSSKSDAVSVPSASPQSSMPSASISVTTPVSADSVNSSAAAASSSSSKQTAPSSEASSTPTSQQPAPTGEPSPSVSKSPRLSSGWLQINKLYTPYVSSTTSNHHLYKIPLSLLTFYDLLKTPTTENRSSDSNEASFPFEETTVTPQEIELINELCLKQNIKPFSVDTKLIDLLTFYHYCSATILFVKELAYNEPKTSIFKDWPSVVQINGGICRLRNIATLQEQTVPFIENNLLKTFAISPQCLAAASLTTPNAKETEFLQLILFLSNMPINLRNAKLIDIDSVQKEYNVDLILLFNDKFPLNVLNYQQQDNRPAVPPTLATQSRSSTANITFTQSTPPPSPPSPPTAPSANSIFMHPPSHLPLTATSSTTASTTHNRYQKTITFHGHTMTVYVCSGLGTYAQRECLSVKALCDMLYPHSSIIDKLEAKMVRLLRAKNINRFRPQNHQMVNFTRLIDMTDVEKHWDYIEQGMRSLMRDGGDAVVDKEASASSALDERLKASTLNTVEDNSEKIEEISLAELNKTEKRALEKPLEEDESPIVERFDKRVRLSNDGGNSEQPLVIRISSVTTTDDRSDQKSGGNELMEYTDTGVGKLRRLPRPPIRMIRRLSDKNNKKNRTSQTNERVICSSPSPKPMRKKIKLTRKRPTPRVRSIKVAAATWVQKYNIEECYVRLDLCDAIYKPRRD